MPVPKAHPHGSNPHDVGDLRRNPGAVDGGGAAGAGGAIVDEAAALLCDLNLTSHRANAIGVDDVEAVLADQRTVGMQHGNAVIVLGEEIIVGGKSQPGQFVDGAGLRGFAAECPGLLLRIPDIENVARDLHEVLDGLLAIVKQALPQLAHGKPDGRDQRHQQHRYQQHQPMRNPHPSEHAFSSPQALFLRKSSRPWW